MRKRLPGDEGAFRQLVNVQKYRAKKYGREFSLTNEQLRKLYKSPCHYCGIEPKQIFQSQSGGESFIYNGLDRLENSKGYTLENVVPCCKPCNLVKYTNPVDNLIRPHQWYGNYFTISPVSKIGPYRVTWECLHNGIIKYVPARRLRQYQKLANKP